MLGVESPQFLCETTKLDCSGVPLRKRVPARAAVQHLFCATVPVAAQCKYTRKQRRKTAGEGGHIIANVGSPLLPNLKPFLRDCACAVIARTFSFTAPTAATAARTVAENSVRYAAGCAERYRQPIHVGTDAAMSAVPFRITSLAETQVAAQLRSSSLAASLWSRDDREEAGGRGW